MHLSNSNVKDRNLHVLQGLDLHLVMMLSFLSGKFKNLLCSKMLSESFGYKDFPPYPYRLSGKVQRRGHRDTSQIHRSDLTHVFSEKGAGPVRHPPLPSLLVLAASHGSRQDFPPGSAWEEPTTTSCSLRQRSRGRGVRNRENLLSACKIPNRIATALQLLRQCTSRLDASVIIGAVRFRVSRAVVLL